MRPTDFSIRLAFNLGAQARIEGCPLDSNPFSSGTQGTLYSWWEQGYLDVHLFWGQALPRGTFPPPLRRVKFEDLSLIA